MFLHERGAYNTLYFTTYFGPLMVSGQAWSISTSLNETGRPHYCRLCGTPLGLAQLLVAQCVHSRRYLHRFVLLFPRNHVAPGSSERIDCATQGAVVMRRKGIGSWPRWR